MGLREMEVTDYVVPSSTDFARGTLIITIVLMIVRGQDRLLSSFNGELD